MNQNPLLSLGQAATVRLLIDLLKYYNTTIIGI